MREELTLHIDGDELVPAILLLPDNTRRAPAALLIHGFSSNKERMSESVGRALLQHGVASLAVDLPLHGAREGGIEGLSLRNPLAVVQKWRLAVRESHGAIDVLASHDLIDPKRIGIAGYSLGAFLATIVASENETVRAVALAAGGDLPEETPFASLVRTIADPRRAVRGIEGRPLLMVNGRYDRRIRPEQARSLFEAAGEPKELRWYNGGHWPPPYAIAQAAEWLAVRLKTPVIRRRSASA
jgi:uncharacterized protein